MKKRFTAFWWVDVDAAIRRGIKFHLASNGCVLTRQVIPPECLAGPSDTPYPPNARVPTSAGLRWLEEVQVKKEEEEKEADGKGRDSAETRAKRSKRKIKEEIAADEVKEESSDDIIFVKMTQSKKARTNKLEKRRLEIKQEQRRAEEEGEISLEGYEEDEENVQIKVETEEQRSQEATSEEDSWDTRSKKNTKKQNYHEELLAQTYKIKLEPQRKTEKQMKKVKKEDEEGNKMTANSGNDLDELKLSSMDKERMVSKAEMIVARNGGEAVLSSLRKHGAFASIAGRTPSVNEFFDIIRHGSSELKIADGAIYNNEGWTRKMDPSSSSGAVRRERKVKEVKRNARYTGEITFIDTQKNYGFIKSTEIKRLWGTDVFFHTTAALDIRVEKSLKVGRKVTFGAERGDTGLPKARNLDLA